MVSPYNSNFAVALYEGGSFTPIQRDRLFLVVRRFDPTNIENENVLFRVIDKIADQQQEAGFHPRDASSFGIAAKIARGAGGIEREHFDGEQELARFVVRADSKRLKGAIGEGIAVRRHLLGREAALAKMRQQLLAGDAAAAFDLSEAAAQGSFLGGIINDLENAQVPREFSPLVRRPVFDFLKNFGTAHADTVPAGHGGGKFVLSITRGKNSGDERVGRNQRSVTLSRKKRFVPAGTGAFSGTQLEPRVVVVSTMQITSSALATIG